MSDRTIPCVASLRDHLRRVVVLVLVFGLTGCSRRSGSAGSGEPGKALPSVALASDSGVPDREVQQNLSQFVGSVARDWKTAGDPLERRYSAGAEQLAQTLLSRCEVRSKDYVGVIGVQPLQKETFDYTIDANTGLPAFAVTINGPFMAALLRMATSTWAHQDVAQTLLKSLVVKELATISFFAEYPYVGRSDALLSRLLNAKAAKVGGALRAADLATDSDLVEIVSFLASYMARGEAVGYAEQARYLWKQGRRIQVEALASYPGLDTDFGKMFLAEAKALGSLDATQEDLVWVVAVGHVQMILDQPRRSADQLSKQHIAFNLAALLEVMQGRATLTNGRIRFNVDPATGRPNSKVMSGIRDPRYFAPKPGDLTKRFGTAAPGTLAPTREGL